MREIEDREEGDKREKGDSGESERQKWKRESLTHDFKPFFVSPLCSPTVKSIFNFYNSIIDTVVH